MTLGRRQFARALSLCVSLAVGSVCLVHAAERYVRATVDEAGNLRVITDDGRTISIGKEAEQVGFEQIEISPRGDAVGWVGVRVNCCTSYDIPTRLFVLSAGQTRKFDGISLPVWKWAFSKSGGEVAFHQETVHGGFAEHYELRDIASGQLVAEYTPEVDRNNQPIPGQVVPEWVVALKGKP